MGAGASVPPADEFQTMLDTAWTDEATRATLIERLKTAQQFVGKKKREGSVGKVPFPLDTPKLDELWKAVDYNGNNFLSLAEIDKCIVESYPEFDNKPAIMRAYHACDRNKNGFISKSEFKNFWGYLEYFTELWEKFEGVDEDGDRRITLDEMVSFSKEIFGREISPETATTLFVEMDRNNGGMVLFYEFAAHMAVLHKKNFEVGKLPFE